LVSIPGSAVVFITDALSVEENEDEHSSETTFGSGRTAGAGGGGGFRRRRLWLGVQAERHDLHGQRAVLQP
jgi:hypothetical protein